MQLIQLKYTGGRSFVKQMFGRKPYVFKKETEYLCEVPQELAKNLLITGQYTVGEKNIEQKTEIKNPLICETCGFIAKSDYGLLVHKRKHQKGE